MKKILLVNKSFEVGGIQSSMINMANELSKYYEVHLFLYNPCGVMKERISPNVKILESSWRFRCLGMTIKETLQTKKIKFIAFRAFAMMWTKIFDNKLPIAIAIKHQPKMIGYDLAVAYHQEQRKKAVTSGFVRFVDKCVEAEKKVAWLHFDCKKIDLDSQFNNTFYEKMDRLVCVSRSLKENFENTYPKLGEKIDYCYNFIPYEVIGEKSQVPQETEYPSDKFVCCSVCRLSPEKALTRSISALADVFHKHPEIVWYIAGDGVERESIENTIKANNLENQIILMGNKPNPYPYIRNADLMINTSYHEAAPMVFLESKTLGTPVFATRTASAEELLNNNVDSFICENSSEGLHDVFEELMEHRELIECAAEKLKEYHASNEESFNKIKGIIG